MLNIGVHSFLIFTLYIQGQYWVVLGVIGAENKPPFPFKMNLEMEWPNKTSSHSSKLCKISSSFSCFSGTIKIYFRGGQYKHKYKWFIFGIAT